MWNFLRSSVVGLLGCSEWAIQPKRTTFILRRVKPVRLNPFSSEIKKKLKRREFYYKLVEDTQCKKQPFLELVLTKDVAGIGMRGEKIEMKPYKAYRDLILPKLALYATSPEAQSIMKTTQERQYSSIYSKIVENYLACKSLKVFLSNEIPWTLQPWHIKLALREVGVFANVDCISIPKEISGPNLDIENRDFLVNITMNKSEKFPVRCRIYHRRGGELSLSEKEFDISDPLFPDEQETINFLKQLEKEFKQNEIALAATGKQKSRKR